MARSKTSRTPARDRILSAAADLFYQEGVQNVGIDRIIAASGVAKMSLYNHFKSKDALIAAWLEARDEQWRTWFQSRVEALVPGDADVVTPVVARRRLQVIFDVLKEWFDQPDFRGCAFINSTVELVNPDHPGYQVALTHNQALLAYLIGLVTAAQLPQPDDLAQQILLLVEGAIVLAMIQKNSNTALQAKQVALVLLADWEKTALST